VTATSPAVGDNRMLIPRIGVRGRALDFVPTSRSKEIAVELEELGYGAVWLPEMAGRDVFVHLTHLLSATRSMIGATGVASIWARDPIAMSCAVRALTEAFPERMLLGVGVSHKDLVQDVRGHEYTRPLSSLRTYLRDLDAAPYRAERPTSPVRRVVGALGPGMLKLAAELTNGAHPYLVPPEHTAWARELMGPEALLCPDQMVVLETDRAKAMDIARGRIGVYLNQPNYTNHLRRFGFGEVDFREGGSDRLVDALVATGTVQQILDRVNAHFHAGADHVSVQPLTEEARGIPLEAWRELAPALASI
jgi:probable F420-dependent oxidoreductase